MVLAVLMIDCAQVQSGTERVAAPGLNALMQLVKKWIKHQ